MAFLPALLPAISALSSAGGAVAGVAKAKSQNAQRQADLKANAIEQRYAWTGNKPQMRDVTPGASGWGMGAAGALSGLMQGKNISDAFKTSPSNPWLATPQSAGTAGSTFMGPPSQAAMQAQRNFGMRS